MYYKNGSFCRFWSLGALAHKRKGAGRAPHPGYRGWNYSAAGSERGWGPHARDT